MERLKNFLENVFLWRSPEKFLLRPFFFGDRLKNFCEDVFLESTCACVLGPWPWPRAFLSLASRVSVLGKAVLGLGLEPCVLDSTSRNKLLISSSSKAHLQRLIRPYLESLCLECSFVHYCEDWIAVD